MYYFFNNFAHIERRRDRSVVVVIEFQFNFENWNFFAILHMLGKTPNVKDLFINSQKGTGIIPFILFKTL